MNNVIENVNEMDVVKLILYPKNIDSLRNLKKNIRVYGYLDFCLGLFNEIIKHKDYKMFYNEIKNSIINNNFSNLEKMYNRNMSKINDKHDRTVFNTFFIATIHAVNKELELYNI